MDCKNTTEDLVFEEISEDVAFENSSNCHTNGPSGCCTTYCTDHGPTCKIQTENSWEAFLEANGGIIQY
ncbi:hypothetical protein JOC27_000680 [Sporolactobacillus spathodeae]|uniref:Uncharacterized protein n=1 Tax=Sporolactobacillus spathodeae TaxID=1465502 RepID=A0ABS2Q619_9BACL|nr:hypothetical protein [Sporolactobacillus spathodeae]